MAVVMRMSRGGRKKVPFYRIVVADSRRARDSKYIEQLGFYNPTAREHEEGFRLNEERVDYWFSKGAKASDALAKLFVKNNVGPKAIRDDLTKRIAEKAKIVEKRKAEEAQRKAKEAAAEASADAEAMADKPAEEAQDAANEAQEPVTEEKPAAEATPAEETPAEEPKQEATPAEETPTEEPKQEAAAEEKPAEEQAAEAKEESETEKTS